MPIEIFAQVTDINGPQRIIISDALKDSTANFYPQKFAELTTVVLGAKRLAIPSFVYRGINRPLTIQGPHGIQKTNGEEVIVLSCGINWMPKYNPASNQVEILPALNKVFYALVNPIDHPVYYAELLWWGFWPEDRNLRGAPDSHKERFKSLIWQVQRH